MTTARDHNRPPKHKSRPLWQVDGADWPNRETSHFVQVGPMRWHVQEAGPADAPVLLLAHGTGAATHSWRWLLPDLARDFRVIAPDLPAHGFTSSLWDSEPSLKAMAKSLSDLLHHLETVPDYAIGHSAGAAILIRMSLDKLIRPARSSGSTPRCCRSTGLDERCFPRSPACSS
jgi:magnesium chelatase accessory protein